MKKFYFFIPILIAFNFFSRAQVSGTNPAICMVTVDDSSRHNIVYYDKTQYAVVDSFILWREDSYNLGTYNRVMSNPTSALSMFLDMDTAADPNKKLHRYKLQAYDASSGYSLLGAYHTVLYCLQQDSNYNWNQYDIEGLGTGQVQKYVILQDDNSTGLWHPVDTVSGAWNSWIDGQVILYPNGQWRLATLWAITCTPTARYGNMQDQSTVVKSKSNITNNRTAGLQALNASSVSLYPNPASANVTVRFNFPQGKNTSVKLFNTLGSVVHETMLPAGKDEISLDVSQLPKGVYVAELVNSGAKITKRLVIQ